MSVRTKNVIKAIVTVALIGTSVFAGAQSYYGNPYTGAGSTIQPSQQYLQQQRQQQVEAQRRANTYYYQPAPPRQTTQQTQFMYPDRSLQGIGFAPNIVQLSPQAANAIGNAAVGCAGAGALGYATGGPIKGVIGCAAGSVGLTPGQLLRPKKAY